MFDIGIWAAKLRRNGGVQAYREIYPLFFLDVLSFVQHPDKSSPL